jgi:hypothetical protein
VDQLVAKPLPTQDNTNRINMQASLHGVGFEPTISFFERAERVRALDRAANVIDIRK